MSDETANIPDWLAALHCPICGDVRLSLAWKAPDYIPEILAGFGPRHPPARRWIVIKLDTVAYEFLYARDHAPAWGVQKTKVHFASTVSAAQNLLKKLREPQVRRAILMAARRKQIRQDGPKWLLAMDLDGGSDLDTATPLDTIDLILELIREGSLEVLRDLDIYYRPVGRHVADSRKKSERALLWEPLFDLMHNFEIDEFDKYQPLIQTVRSLHLALGIDPPDSNLLKQVAFLWRKRRLNSAARFCAT